MSQVHRFTKLSPLIQKMVIERLEKNGHRDFVGIAKDLQAMGYRISKSSVHRFSKALRSDAAFLNAWALENPELATVLVSALKVSPAGSIKLDIQSTETASQAMGDME